MQSLNEKCFILAYWPYNDKSLDVIFGTLLAPCTQLSLNDLPLLLLLG